VTFETSAHVSYSISGVSEKFNSGYDYFTIYRDGAMKAQVSSSNELIECEMLSVSDDANEDLPPGTYTFRFVADTGDNRYHVNMTHTGTVSWS